jgi:hypothetical protein
MDGRAFTFGVGVAYVALLAVGLQVERPEFRPWELLAKEQGDGFEPSQMVRMQEIGDLGYATWVRRLQAPRDTVFTTDASGLRNARDREWAPVVVLGDSFVVGSGVSDHETMPSRLEALLGVPVYNYGIPRANSPAYYEHDARFLAHPAEVVVFAPNQRNLKPGAFARLQRGARNAARDAGAWVGAAEDLRGMLSVVERDNGLGRGARYLVQGVRHRVWGDVPGHLVATADGRPALLATPEVLDLVRTPEQRGVEAFLHGLVRFSNYLETQGTRLVFAPLPDQAHLYPELYPPQVRTQIHQPTTLDVVIGRARAAGIPTIDVRETLYPARQPYLYLRDDTHFDARGLEIVAREVSVAVSALRR